MIAEICLIWFSCFIIKKILVGLIKRFCYGVLASRTSSCADFSDRVLLFITKRCLISQGLVFSLTERGGGGVTGVDGSSNEHVWGSGV